jgi:hypothetical protein
MEIIENYFKSRTTTLPLEKPFSPDVLVEQGG